MSTPDPRIGLCALCRHVRVQTTSRSRFYRCARSVDDPRFPKYPPVPVVECDGFEATPRRSSG